jgi:hypothetical protein
LPRRTQAGSIAEIMKTVKAKSSKYINDHRLTRDRFEWQRGYGVFSYSQSAVDNVYRYFKIRRPTIAKKHSRMSILKS